MKCGCECHLHLLTFAPATAESPERVRVASADIPRLRTVRSRRSPCRSSSPNGRKRSPKCSPCWDLRSVLRPLRDRFDRNATNSSTFSLKGNPTISFTLARGSPSHLASLHTQYCDDDSASTGAHRHGAAAGRSITVGKAGVVDLSLSLSLPSSPLLDGNTKL